ncbi:unknown protein [Oryza sativa Japonica Group]|uniref:DUF4220 domain-containing protein n=3 Tax=Oryza sativa TaxID=4530 RepID=Q7F6E1_ORYSJ|nr:uncharacterized protein LOC4325719 [Oryza sativa Japonica Group]KAB8081475.1 hypothetical protein EE612_002696 [Oryza sativa]EAZ11948.1 hypothetical protein OsJ_01821 [Oryza sativa Japonica Group]KAF2950201.1 hypothetical protein DAI22_01g171200 [Oryza sativa Japonica Group]BAB61143.1 unknown protein [Oryza sativa Japonica Group]BAB64056.1 unknown protein [Oryza sativa Japonica Group]
MASSLINLLLTEVAAIVSIVLLALLVVLSSYRRRSGHPALRLFVWAASTLFLPLVSYAVSAAAKWDAARVPLLLAWTVFLQMLRNTIDTARSSSSTIGNGSGSSKFRPSVEQLARMGWVAFLIVSSDGTAGSPQLTGVLLWLWVLSLAKLVHRLVAAELAKNSFAVGLNAYLISDYMKQLYGQDQGDHDVQAPPLLVMGEEKLQIEARPQGYRIGRTSPPPLCVDAGHVVTMDRICRLFSSGDPLVASNPQIKDTCLSFALFKLQLRRFVGCPIAEAGSRRSVAFVLDGLLGESHERVFRVIETELSFLADFLYSKLTVFYASGWWFPVLNSMLVFATWVSCLAAGGAIVHDMTCHGTTLASNYDNLREYLQNHDTVFHIIVGLDVLVTVSFIVAIVFTEGWEIATYVRSDWIKVSAICEYARRPSWRKSPWTRRNVGRVLPLKPMQRWDDRFGQTSILQLRPCYCGCVSRQVDRIAKSSATVPAAVKTAVVDTLRTNQGNLGNGVLSLQRNGVADKLAWACHHAGDERSVSEQILVWHVATRLLEIMRSEGAHGRHDDGDGDGGGDSDTVVVATRLSRYCAYLVALKPELLPDHPAWTEELYEGVVEEVSRVLARFAGAVVRYERAATCLGGSTNATLRKAAKLGRQLAEELGGDEELPWRVLADFWAELVVYLAPSENVTAHSKALRRGGEFITVLWALLGHAGIVSRPDTDV